jgi:hypothetical protein
MADEHHGFEQLRRPINAVVEAQKHGRDAHIALEAVAHVAISRLEPCRPAHEVWLCDRLMAVGDGSPVVGRAFERAIDGGPR